VAFASKVWRLKGSVFSSEFAAMCLSVITPWSSVRGGSGAAAAAAAAAAALPPLLLPLLLP